MFGSGFLTHQGSLTDVVVERGLLTQETGDSLDNVEMVGRDMDRVEFFQQVKLTMDMKTNVPEPFKAEINDEEIKEGLPVGLSDSHVSSRTSSLITLLSQSKSKSKSKVLIKSKISTLNFKGIWH